MDPELKALLDTQTKTFEEFKAANDAAQAEIKKLGAADALTLEKVEKLSQALDASQDALKKRADDTEARLNRMQMSGGGTGGEEAKHAEAFARQIGGDFSVDDLKSYHRSMDTYLRKGAATPASDVKTLSVGSEPDGGYLVTPDTSGRIIRKIYESSPIRQIATVQSIGTDAYEGLIDNGEADAGWVGEKQARPETDTPQWGKWTIAVNEVYAQPAATQKVLEDAQIDLEAWLEAKASEKIARVENLAFLRGDGNLKPRGLLDYPTAATPDASRAWGTFEHIGTGQSGAFPSSNPADKLLDVIYALKPAYRQNARWLTSRPVIGTIRKFKDGQGNYLWQPGMQAGQPSSILGFPVTECEDMPALAANSLSIGFGDVRETYTIVDRVGISVLRDPYTTKGFVKFYTRRRTGGGALNFESFKLLKFI
ncbi:Major capsid protein, HK97 family protein [Hyphomicrobiales bacterium]|nr:Major capsid protein, HK97 family protein [Hyphomicrobiales bacterium]CAH1667714.1 Major capsid protein, HK97 family protein [Hyphomicrobiales bacterium]